MYRRSSFFYLVVAVILLATGVQSKHQHDVCILGGGAGGAGLAYMLKDIGYDVLVIEKHHYLGGHCNTVRFTHEGNPAWIEAGVAIYPNTSFANSLGCGPWLIDMEKEITRFATITKDPYGNIARFAANFNTGVDLGPHLPTFDPTAFGMALMRFRQQLMTSYPWADTMLDPPTVLPPELLVPFDQWLSTNNYQILEYLFNATIYDAGWGRFSKVSAWDALLQSSCVSTMYGIAPGSWFSVYNGCQSIYEGIASYLGEDAVMLNAHVTHAIRPEGSPSKYPVHLVGEQNGKRFMRNCGKLVVAYQQTPKNLKPLHLDSLESALFESVSVHDVQLVMVDVTGPRTQTPGAWGVANVDPNNVKGAYQPAVPNLISIINLNGFGPSIATGISEELKTTEEMVTMMKSVAKTIPKTELEITNWRNEMFRHQLDPHWPTSFLGQSVNPYIQLDALQGHRNTYWVGALRNTASTGAIWNLNKAKIVPLFPPKTPAAHVKDEL